MSNSSLLLNQEISESILAKNPQCNPTCRACHYKDIDYLSQLFRKQHWAESQLCAWKPVLQEIVPAPPQEQLKYRSKSWLRIHPKNENPREVSFGMFRALRVNGKWEKEFISWDTCPLHLDAITQVVGNLKTRLLDPGWVGVWVGNPHLVLVARDPQLKETLQGIRWDEILVQPLNQVWFHANSQVGKVIFGHRAIEKVFDLHENESCSTRIHPIRAFRQVAQTLLNEARNLACQSLLESCPNQVLDLYCGTGELSLLLPPEVSWIGVELNSDAVQYANSLRIPRMSFHRAFTGAIEHRLADPQVLSSLVDLYSLYLNPPRSGLSLEAQERVLELIDRKAPLSVVYLSCSASSLARDLRLFESRGYEVRLLQPYDFFPQTEHFETLAVLTRRETLSSAVSR